MAGNAECADFASAKYDRWANLEILAMVQIWAEQAIQQKLASIKRNNAVFVEIEERLAELGFHKTAGQIKNKLKLLKQTYYKIKRLNNTSGEKPHKFEYFEIFDSVLGTKDVVCASTFDSFDINLESTENSEMSTHNFITKNLEVQMSSDESSPLESSQLEDLNASSASCESSRIVQTSCEAKTVAQKRNTNDKLMERYMELEERNFQAMLKHNIDMAQQADEKAQAAEMRAYERQIEEREHEREMMQMYTNSMGDFTKSFFECFKK